MKDWLPVIIILLLPPLIVLIKRVFGWIDKDDDTPGFA